jgi:hypothetical protein
MNACTGVNPNSQPPQIASQDRPLSSARLASWNTFLMTATEFRLALTVMFTCGFSTDNTTMGSRFDRR